MKHKMLLLALMTQRGRLYHSCIPPKTPTLHLAANQQKMNNQYLSQITLAFRMHRRKWQNLIVAHHPTILVKSLTTFPTCPLRRRKKRYLPAHRARARRLWQIADFTTTKRLQPTEVLACIRQTRLKMNSNALPISFSCVRQNRAKTKQCMQILPAAIRVVRRKSVNHNLLFLAGHCHHHHHHHWPTTLFPARLTLETIKITERKYSR